MDFFPFKPYYYPQNRYSPYGGMQARGINPAYQGQRNKEENYYLRSRQTRRNNETKSEKISQGSKEQKQQGYFNQERQAKEKQNEEECNTRKFIPQLDKFDEPIFEIFGLKLFFDDVLIISLIFFLYNEGVRDNLLFVSLVLILLS